LNVLQSSAFERVGGTETLKSDVRVIAATNRNLEAKVAESRFREDLFYRINVISVTMPPLRERSDDIALLVRYFLNKQADLSGKRIDSIASEVMEKLKEYPFPGNVRELENWIERAVVLAEGKQLVREDFPDQLISGAVKSAATAVDAGGLEERVSELEISAIREALDKHNGNQSAAARELKITERSIRYKMKKYGL
jgi:transcriptional regulator with PAS, ATPase and Fis domain